MSNGKRPPTSENGEDASVPILGAHGRTGFTHSANFGPGYLIGRVGSVGKVTRVDGRVWASDNAIAVEPRSEILSDRFADHLLRYLDLQRVASRNVQPLLTQARVCSVVATVPVLPEQRRIAHVVDTADAVIRRTEAVIDKLEQVKQGLLHDLLTRGLDEEGQLRPPPKEVPSDYIHMDGRAWRAEWDIVNLSDCIDIESGQVDPREEPYASMPLIAPNHLEEGTGRLLQTESASEQGAKSGKYLFGPGDVVYSKIRPYLRKVMFADFSGLCSADMYPLHARDDILPQFLHLWLLGEHFSRFAEAVSMRSGIPKINRAELGEYTFRLPPLSEQSRIVDVLATHGRRVRTERESLAKLTKLKEGLMQDLLTGRVRVPESLEVPA